MSDVIVTCTPARVPFLGFDAASAGCFVAAVGANNPAKSEIKPNLMARATVVVDALDHRTSAETMASSSLGQLADFGQRKFDLRSSLSGHSSGRPSFATNCRQGSAEPSAVVLGSLERIELAARSPRRRWPGFKAKDLSCYFQGLRSLIESQPSELKAWYCIVATEEHPVQTQDVRYSEGEVEFLGYLAFDETARDKQPGVLVVHEGLGLGEHIMERTRRIAKLGYVVFAADMFGGRRQASDLQEMSKLVGDLRNDLATLRARGRAALTTLGSFQQVDPTRLAAVGFCFGGSVVLELARDGADLRAVVSLHGVLSTKAPAETEKIKASVLVCTGADDPLAPADQVAAFENEMRAANVQDWQVISYGNTLHAFTNPIAGPSTMKGTLYNEQADRRSWIAVRNFLEELLNNGDRSA